MNKKEDEIYCPKCGKIIKKIALICPICGVQVRKLEINQIKTEIKITPKKRWVALVLALFFNFWAWIYTYQKNYKKFWVMLAITIFLLSFIIFSILGFGLSYGNIEYWEQLRNLSYFYYLYFSCLWLWVTIDYARRPNKFYSNYPND